MRIDSKSGDKHSAKQLSSLRVRKPSIRLMKHQS
jgi:hypothetical protein